MKNEGFWRLGFTVGKMLLISDIAFVAEPKLLSYGNSITRNSHKAVTFGRIVSSNPLHFRMYGFQKLFWKKFVIEQSTGGSLLYCKSIMYSKKSEIYRILSDINPRSNHRLINRWLLKKL